MTKRYKLFPKSELDPGERRFVSVRGTEIAVFNLGGSYFALENECPHQGGPVCDGETHTAIGNGHEERIVLDKERLILTCPWHGWSFEIATGDHPSGDYSINTFEVEVVGDELYLIRL